MARAFLWSHDLSPLSVWYADDRVSRSFDAAGEPVVSVPLDSGDGDVVLTWSVGLLPLEYEPSLPIHVLVRVHSATTTTVLKLRCQLAARIAGDAVAPVYGPVVSLGDVALPGSASVLQDRGGEIAPGAEQGGGEVHAGLLLRLVIPDGAGVASGTALISHVRLYQEIP